MILAVEAMTVTRGIGAGLTVHEDTLAPLALAAASGAGDAARAAARRSHAAVIEDVAYDDWLSGGRATAIGRAHAVATSIVGTHVAPALEPGVDAHLRRLAGI